MGTKEEIKVLGVDERTGWKILKCTICGAKYMENEEDLHHEIHEGKA